MDPGERRQQIVRVAADHFARLGVAGASMSEIAKDAGVTRALLYHYFTGKEALLDAVLRRESDRLLRATMPDRALSPRQNLTRALGAYLDFFAASSGGVRELYSPATAVPTVEELNHANHEQHVYWLLEYTGQPDTPRTRLALGGWLAFVEFTARQGVEAATVGRDSIIDVCISTLEGALGTSFGVSDVSDVSDVADTDSSTTI
jgi:AcrR family transcriptional regulator